VSSSGSEGELIIEAIGAIVFLLISRSVRPGVIGKLWHAFPADLLCAAFIRRSVSVRHT